MSTLQKVIEKVFGGRRSPLRHIEKGAGVPSHAAARLGQIYWDTTSSDAYICTVKTGTWVKIND